MKKTPPSPFEGAEGNAPLTFLLSGVLASFHTVSNHLAHRYQQ